MQVAKKIERKQEGRVINSVAKRKGMVAYKD